MLEYKRIVSDVLTNGKLKENRTGVTTIAKAGVMFQHDMTKGFPLLTTKRMLFRLIASELQFFIRGYTDKKWLQKRGNHIWDEWCSPEKVTYGHDLETRYKMEMERDLGPIYGFQWRHFGASYMGFDWTYKKQGIDQLKKMVETLKNDPDDRGMIVTAWNPEDLPYMALRPCHYAFQVTVINGELHLLWNQRSVDVAIGLPFNIAFYALLLLLLAEEAGLRVGTLTGFLADTHIYVNHIDGLKEQLKRPVEPLPVLIKNKKYNSIFDWDYDDCEPARYKCHPAIKFEIAV